MARQRSTFGKLQRERDKQAKAQAKQERRAARAREASQEQPVEAPTAGQDELLAALAELHGDLEAGRISLEQFQSQREQLRVQLNAGNWV